MAQLSLQRKYGLIFLLGWLANLFLCCLVAVVLVRALLAVADPDHWVLFSFWTHVALFVGFSGALLFFLLLNSYTAVIFTIVFTVCQFLCVLITSLTLIADDDSNREIGFKRDPILWIKSRHWVPILFSAIFLPLFAAQIFLINRYAGHLGLGGKRSGYSAPTTN
uniref:MARVEL domain-containing protein n=2 Tax=Globodera pallida TaxID=36090 RepID=A0A183CLT2_GLOPA